MIIQIDVANAFNSTNRGLTLDVLNGRASRDYACGLKKGDVIPTCDTLSNLFGYFKAIGILTGMERNSGILTGMDRYT